MGYVPLQGSQAEKAITYIQNRTSARTGAIADLLGVEFEQVEGILANAVNAGLLVACDVNVPGMAAAKEYRIGGGMAAVSRRDFTINPNKRPPRPDAKAPAAEPAKREKKIEGSTRAKKGDRQQEIVKTLARIKRQVTLDELLPHFPSVTRSALKQAMQRAVDAKLIKSSGTRSERVFFAPGVDETNPLPVKRGPGRKRTVEAQVRRAPTAKVQPKTARSQPPVPVPAPASDFRCGLMSDGALRLDGDFSIDEAGIVIMPGQTAVLVDYLRRLDMLGQAS